MIANILFSTLWGSVENLQEVMLYIADEVSDNEASHHALFSTDAIIISIQIFFRNLDDELDKIFVVVFPK